MSAHSVENPSYRRTRRRIPHNLVAFLRRTVQALRSNNQALSMALRQISAAQERLLESERMAAVGRVTSGIAHEIGNQLSVLTYAELIRDRYPDDSEVRLFTSIILSARARLAGLVNEIRDFSRIHVTEPGRGIGEVSSPNDEPRFSLIEEPMRLAVQEGLSILRFDPAFRLRHVERSLDCDATARINRDKLVQVILNLLRNAVDATQPGGEIHVRLSADPLTVDRPLIRLSIEDHGEGILPETLPRIFEPFFSTKGEQGTGLGLGICRSIVMQHSGELLIESPVLPASKSGTRVTVTLPRLA